MRPPAPADVLRYPVTIGVGFLAGLLTDFVLIAVGA